MLKYYFNQFAILFNVINPQKELFMWEVYITKKLLFKLGLNYEKIGYCINNYMLFYKNT